jgi:PAS domain S-box-containing protein
MIVEDEGLIANDLAGQLGKSGYAVAGISASGEEALAALSQSPADLVLMDIRLKGNMDGIDAAVRVRTEHNLPVIFLTSYADSGTLERAKKAEPFGYLVKPFRQLNLCSAIEMALYKHGVDRALMEREAWLSSVLESTADATVVTGADGHVQFFNSVAARLTGYSLPGAIGLRWTDIAPLSSEETGSAVDDLVSLATIGARQLRFPAGTLLKNRAGVGIPVEGEVSPSISRGKIAGAIVTMRDISQRHALEAEYRHREKVAALGRLAGGLAHDFNNLLQVITGHASLLATGPATQMQSMSISAILNAACTSAEITRQLLTLSRNQVLAAAILPVNSSVERAVRAVTPNLDNSVRLELALDPDAGNIRMNSTLFDQVLVNLLLNARNSIPDGGDIRISTSHLDRIGGNPGEERLETCVRVSVADSGEPVPADGREHIFDPFYSSKPHGKSAGLRLAIVYGIVKDAGGEITLESTAGAGNRFDLLLPRFEDSESLPIIGLQHEPEHGTQGPRTILLVEDQPEIRKLILHFFERHGFRLLGAANGQEALEAAAAYPGPIDLLISDVLMPKMDGPSLARRLAQSRPGIKTLFISGQPGDSIEALRHAAQTSEFLQKPFALPVLLKKVQELIS